VCVSLFLVAHPEIHELVRQAVTSAESHVKGVISGVSAIELSRGGFAEISKLFFVRFVLLIENI